MKNLIYYLICGFFFLSMPNVDAAVVTWIGGNGAWDDDNNWDTGTAPNQDDGVIITSGTVMVDNFVQADYIHLDGGNLEVVSGGLLYITPVTPWYGTGNLQVRGIVIEYGSNFNNYGSTIIIEYNDLSASLISCYGNMTNQSDAFLFCQGYNSTGIRNYSQSGTIYNYGVISMAGIDQGMYLLNQFNNYGDIEIGSNDIAIYNRATFYSGSASNLKVNGRIVNTNGTVWNQYGNVEVNYTSSSNASIISMNGLFEIQNSGSLSVNGSHSSVSVSSDGTLRIRGDLDINNSKPYSSSLSNSGLIVNHQNGVVNTSAYYGINNFTGGETRNYGVWRAKDELGTFFSSLRNWGVFSNRPKGKLYVEGRMNLYSGSTFNNQGHMFVLDDFAHQNLLGQFNNTGTLNDVHDRMGFINNNTSVRVHKVIGPWTEGVPVSNVLDVGNSPGATVLSWYTSSSGNTIAGTYNSSTNTFTPNANAVGLSSLFVRTRINTGGVTRRHELIVENGINGSPSPLTKASSEPIAVTKETFTVAPNPIQNTFSILLENQKHKKLNYAIYNSLGQKESFGMFDSYDNVLDVPNYLPSGLFFLSVTDSDGKLIDTKQIRILR